MKRTGELTVVLGFLVLIGAVIASWPVVTMRWLVGGAIIGIGWYLKDLDDPKPPKPPKKQKGGKDQNDPPPPSLPDA